MNIAVYCASSDKIDANYKAMAFRLGEWIAENGHTLVYGGAAGGLMDAVSDGVLAQNGKIIGVIAKAIIKLKRTTDKPMQLIVAQTMSERKTIMKALADAFVVLPGSFGTLDEAMDVVASGTVGEHKKPCVFVNHKGFYNQFFEQIEHCRTEHFIPFEEGYKPLLVNSLEECCALLK
jgi:uncharacterized protein (TIGR00730 family)